MITTKKCPRCRADFACDAADISRCDCATVSVQAATHLFLQQTNYDCVCRNCLTELDDLVAKAATLTPNTTVENVHYYIENGYLVFTELYHIQRGSCCKSGCRHCAYGTFPK